MKSKILLFLCVFALIAACLTSCGKCDHTFSDEWYSDAENHWHPATCEHGEEKEGFGPHVDANEDSVCDICGGESVHIHSYENSWSFDAEHHWKKATCSHTDVKGENSLHSDEDNNGVCDVCTGHVHNVNAAGYCKHEGCGEKLAEVDETNLDALVNAVFSQSHLVNGGSINYSFEGKSNTGANYVATKLDIVEYLFGKNNYTYVKVNSSAVNAGVSAESVLETWTQLIGPETTFGVYKEDDNSLSLDMSDPNKIKGYYIALSTLAGDYGVEGTLYSLYEAAIGDTVDELVVIPDAAENKVTFKYSYKTVFVNSTEIAVGDNAGEMVHNVNYFEVEVTFTYNDEYALTGLIISVDSYTNDPGTNNNNEFLENDVDLDYDPDTDTFTLRENALADNYRIVVTQTVGDRTEENPNPRSKFIPENFDLYFDIDDEGVLSNKYVGQNIKVDIRDVINLYVGDCYPAGTSIHFVADIISFKVYRNDVEYENVLDYENDVVVADFTFAGSQRSFFIIPKTDGSYRFEIYLLGEKLYDISFKAGVIEDEYIDLKDNEFAAKVYDTYSWTNEVTFTAKESGTYYFTVPAGIGFIDADALDAADQTPATDDGPLPLFDFQATGNVNGGTFAITLEAGETFRFYASASKRGTYVISYYFI